MDEFFGIPLLLARIFFSTPSPCWCCLTRGRGNPQFGGLVTLDQNETFHSLFLCYPATFGEKKIVFHCLPPPSGASFVGVGEIGILWPNIFKDKYQHQSYISIDSEKRFDIIT